MSGGGGGYRGGSTILKPGSSWFSEEAKPVQYRDARETAQQKRERIASDARDEVLLQMARDEEVIRLQTTPGNYGAKAVARADARRLNPQRPIRRKPTKSKP